MRIMILGGRGELGTALANVARAFDHDAVQYGREEVDVAELEQITQAIGSATPDVIVNCAAYHKVDEAEQNAAKAFAVNWHGSANVAFAARTAKVKVVYVSTDYVFSGKKAAPYLESDMAAPINMYGFSKFAGEISLSSQGPDVPWLIVRTAGLFGGHGKSQKGGDFFRRILTRQARGESLSVVDDTFTSFTYVPDLARAIVGLLELGATGIRHIVNQGYGSWLCAADLAMRAAGRVAEITPISSSKLTATASRPMFSVLGSQYREVVLPHWKPQLAGYASALGEQHLGQCDGE